MKDYLRYYVELPFPLMEVDRTLTALPGEFLDEAAREANLRGLLMLGPCATTSELRLTAADVCVSLSAPLADSNLVRRPLQWFAGRGDLMDPVLQGDLELAELGPTRTQLAITAQYRPAGDAARAPNRTMAQRVGESTLKAFLDRLATYLQEMLGGTTGALLNPSVNPAASMPAGTRARFEIVGRAAT